MSEKHLELLAIATTAIRDHYMGFPDDEIAAPSGMGTKTLLRDLVEHLRGNGVNDEGGWDCDATEGIKVLVMPAVTAFRLVVEAYAVSEFGDGPSFAEFMVDQSFLGRIDRLRRVCKEYALESVSVWSSPENWDNQEELRIRDDSLRVFHGNSFWFEAHPKHADYNVETQQIEIDDLFRVAEKISCGDTENPLPDGFAIFEGVVGYNTGGTEEAIEMIRSALEKRDGRHDSASHHAFQ